MNMFRLPVGWQYLVNNKLGGTLDSGNTAKYDQLVQACLATGAHCVIDVSFFSWTCNSKAMMLTPLRSTTVCHPAQIFLRWDLKLIIRRCSVERSDHRTGWSYQ